jgi:hypothetical protein
MSLVNQNVIGGSSALLNQIPNLIPSSLRFNASQSSYLSWTPASAGNRKTYGFSCWAKRGALSSNQNIVAQGNNEILFRFNPSDYINFADYTGGSAVWELTSASVYRDCSAWYHIVFAVDTTQATSANRIKVWVNNVQVTFTGTYPSQNSDTPFNTTNAMLIGNRTGSTQYFDGYLTEVNFIDGQALDPSSFGEFDSVTGVWKPAKYTGTYGTNGFFLDFSDATSATTLGYDYSGQSNNWTLNNFNTTSTSTAYCSMTDTPTPYADGGNYAVLNPLEKYSGLTIADGNLKVTSSNNTQYGAAGTLAVSSGKWYYEAAFSNASANNMAMGLTTTQNNVQTAQWAGSTGMFMCGNFVTGTAIYTSVDGSYTQVSTTLPSANSYLVCAVDYDNGKAWFGTTTSSGGAVTWYPASTGGSVGDPAAGTNPTITFSTTYPVRPFMGSYGAGLNWIVNFGQRPFVTTPPSGFNTWHTGNLPEPDIVDGSQYFDVLPYIGNGFPTSGTQSVTGLDFQPDFLWIKDRSAALNHFLQDSIRGSTKVLRSNTTGAENTEATAVTSFDANGFSLGANNEVNTQNDAYVAWNWKANGTGVTNTDGSITSTVSANPTAGFSIVTYTGTGSNATVGHSLGTVPSMVITKRRDSTGNWPSYHKSLGSTDGIYLNLTNATTASTLFWNDTAPTSSVFYLGSGAGANSSGGNHVAYCFAEVESYSKFGSYLGNGSTDGPFVYCGFRPKFLLVKCSNGAFDWHITDTSRSTYNQADTVLFPNSSAAETNGGGYYYDILSNGFKCRNLGAATNGNGYTYIYMAFAENPFKNSLAR